VRRSLLVIGAGLTGLFAAVVAARRGAAVRLITEGRGGLVLSHGCIDIWRDGDLRFSLGRLDRSHPLRIAGWSALEAAFAAFLEILHDVHLPYAGSLDRRWRLPTALGTTHITAAAPVRAVWTVRRKRRLSSRERRTTAVGPPEARGRARAR